MSRVPALSLVPSEVRAWLDRELAARGFGDYEALSEALNARLADHGLELTIARSTLGAYGKSLKRRIETIRASTEAAKAIADAAPDDEDARSAAVLSLVQSDLFEVLLHLQESQDEDLDPAARVELLAKAGRAIAEITRGSLAQKRWAAEVRKKVAEDLASRVDREGGAVTADRLREIMRETYGI